MPTAEQIARWTKEGHWPPPEGVILLPDAQPDPEAITHLLYVLRNILTPDQAASINQIIGTDPEAEKR